jgi:hypothetical protein
MGHRPFPVVELILLSGILASGYMIVAVAKATATPVAVSSRHDKQPTASEAANPASDPAPILAPRTRFSSARPPVPLPTSRHAAYWVEEPQQPTAPTTEDAVTEPTDKRVTSDATAKAMVEADGYKNVRALVQAPGGVWRGLAMRGAVEIAISVDANGRVLAE